jgi:NAD(P)-dependent dehydrogenase (short-subunit alcohol dehydrogenase family)
MGKLEGKIALITGGNSGIGLATAKQFVNEGAFVFITGRRTACRDVTGIQGVDIVFANAGVARYARFGKITEEFYDSIFDINVKGVLFTVQKALPLLPDGASIILNASIVAAKVCR